MIRTVLLSLLLSASAACDAQAPAGNAQAAPPIVRVSSTDRLPPLTGRVVDQADILDAAAEAQLGARLEALEKETTDQVVVMTVPSLEGEPIRDFGMRIANGWGVGRKGVDNGVLLIVAPNERQARIAVGYGLEGLLTDERAAQILKERALPNFAQGRFERGVSEGIEAIAATLESDLTRPRRRAKAAA